jgi:hypothetical protein
MTMQHFDYIEVSGTPRDRGRGHGEGLRERIRERDRVWRDQIEMSSRMRADRFIERFLGETHFLPAIERWTPGLLDEVHGLAEGSNLPFPAVLAAQFMDEEWWYQQSLTGAHHCSSVGGRAASGAGSIVGQTMDLPVWMNGFQTLLLIRDAAPGTDAHVVTVAGMIGLMGANSRGLGVCVNTLLQLNHSAAGLPVAFVSRGLIERPNAREAAHFLTSVNHASGQNYVLGDRREIVDYECSAGGAAQYSGVRDGAVIWHTNHPFANGDLKPDLTGPVWDGNRLSSECRLRSLDERLGRDRPFDVAVVREALSARDDERYPVSRERHPDRGAHPGSFFTFAAMIAELAEQPRLHFAAGAPSHHEFTTYGLDRSMPAMAAAQ